ncbi:MAG TPA: hypothetical protein VNX47_10125, partial [Nevskia sp.]|nr:hypothetical protein [Nevskia sp.]
MGKQSGCVSALMERTIAGACLALCLCGGAAYAGSGQPSGSQFLVTNTTVSAQSHPKAGSDAAGDFVVVWESYNGNDWDVYARCYDSSANPRGGEFRVNNTTAGDQRFPAVAMDPGGGFLVAWES